MHTPMSSSLARNFFCNLACGSASSNMPRSPTTTCGQTRKKKEDYEEEKKEGEEEEDEEAEERAEEEARVSPPPSCLPHPTAASPFRLPSLSPISLPVLRPPHAILPVHPSVPSAPFPSRTSNDFGT